MAKFVMSELAVNDGDNQQINDLDDSSAEYDTDSIGEDEDQETVSD